VRKCILIVDDNPTIRHLLRTTFEDISGWEISEAENGREAIDKGRELNCNLIVLDLSMPIMNGLQAAPVLRRMLPTVPIVLFTLYGSRFLEREALSAGVTAIVSKDAPAKTLVNQPLDLLRDLKLDSQSN
jgi:two-component system, NarL family, nitrate/nitrite response regulator NarL